MREITGELANADRREVPLREAIELVDALEAEFLAPAVLLRSSVSTPSVSLEEIEQLGVDFGVSVMVIAHQLENHRIAVPEPY